MPLVRGICFAHKEENSIRVITKYIRSNKKMGRGYYIALKSKSLLLLAISLWLLIIGNWQWIVAGVPPECTNRLQPGCFMPVNPADPNDQDTPENREIRDKLYDETVKFLQDKGEKGGGGRSLSQIACDIAVQLMCFASGIESAAGADARRMIGVPQKAWRIMLKRQPFVIRRLLEAIWQVVISNAGEITFETPEIRNAFADIRSMWKRGGGFAKVSSASSTGTSARGVSGSSTRRSAFPRIGAGRTGLRRPPVVMRRQSPTQIPGSPVTQTGTMPTSQDVEIEPTYPPPQQQAPVQRQSQGSPPQPSSSTGGGSGTGGGNPTQQSGGGTGNSILQNLLSRIDSKLSRNENTPKDFISLEDFRRGLKDAMNKITDPNLVAQDNTFGGNILNMLGVKNSDCTDYAENECKSDKIGVALTDVDKCPYFVLKNIRNCLDPSKFTSDVDLLTHSIVDQVIKKVLENPDSLYEKLRGAHDKIKSFLTNCSSQIMTALETILNDVGNECGSTAPQILNKVLRSINALKTLLRNHPDGGKCGGNAPPLNLYAAMFRGLNTYKMLYGFLKLDPHLINKKEYEGCQIIGQEGDNAYKNAPGGITDEPQNVTVEMIFTQLLKNTISDVLSGQTGIGAQCISNPDLANDLFSVCGEMKEGAAPICTAAGLKEYMGNNNLPLDIPLYIYPTDPDGKLRREIMNYCNYYGAFGGGPNPTPDDVANMARNMLLCLLVSAFFEGKDNPDSVVSGTSIPTSPNELVNLFKMLVGHGCRSNLYYGELDKIKEGCPIPKGIGDMDFNKKVGNSTRQALTLPEILDSVFKTREGGTSRTYLSPLTDVEGGPIWQYCVAPAEDTMRKTITMVYKFWAILRAIAGIPIKTYADKILQPVEKQCAQPSQCGADDVSTIVTKTTGESPLDVIAGTGDDQLYMKLAKVLVEIANTIYTEINNIATPEELGDLKTLIIKRDVLWFSKLSPEEKESVSINYKYGECTCTFTSTGGQIKVECKNGAGSNCLDSVMQKMVREFQNFILYYLIGAPFFFANSKGKIKGSDEDSPLVSSSRDDIIFGGDESLGKIYLLPFRERYSWGFWRLPFLVAKTDGLTTRSTGGGNTTWYDFIRLIGLALVENFLLTDMISTVMFRSQDRDSYEFDKKITGVIAKEINLERSTVAIQGGRGDVNILTLVKGDCKSVSVKKNEDCLADIFSKNCSDDGYGYLVWSDAAPANLSNWIVLEKGEWATDAPAICQYLIDVSGVTDDSAKTHPINKCLSILSRISLFIGLVNGLLRDESVKNIEQLVIDTTPIAGDDVEDMRFLPSYFTFYRAKRDKDDPKNDVWAPLISTSVEMFKKGKVKGRKNEEEMFSPPTFESGSSTTTADIQKILGQLTRILKFISYGIFLVPPPQDEAGEGKIEKILEEKAKSGGKEGWYKQLKMFLPIPKDGERLFPVHRVSTLQEILNLDNLGITDQCDEDNKAIAEKVIQKLDEIKRNYFQDKYGEFLWDGKDGSNVCKLICGE